MSSLEPSGSLLSTGCRQLLVQLVLASYTPGLREEYVREKGESEGQTFMTWKSKLVLGVLTALAMMVLTYALPRGGGMRDAAVVQFPVTVGVWAIFVLLFVKLK